MNNKITLKVKFNNKFNLPLENKQCILAISVGQKYHEDDYLSSAINLINQSKFGCCTIVVTDTLQRHNCESQSLEEAHHLALIKGDEWLARNEETINKLTLDCKILRWDEVLNNSNFSRLKSTVENEYINNKVYSDAVNSTINTFLERIKKRDPYVDLKLAFEKCFKYVIEECVISMPLWSSQGYDFIIYPKVISNAMSMTREIFVKPYYPNKVNWLSLKFNKIFTTHVVNHHELILDVSNSY